MIAARDVHKHALAVLSVACITFVTAAPLGAAADNSLAFTFDVPVKLTKINAARPGSPAPRIAVVCAVASGTSVSMISSSGSTGAGRGLTFRSGAESTGQAGIIVGQSSVSVQLDNTVSYSGPPIAVVVNAKSAADAGKAHSYVCVLTLDGEVIRDTVSQGSGARGGTNTFPYVHATFHTESSGPIQ